jgi:beta-glucanase (GH16 family)
VLISALLLELLLLIAIRSILFLVYLPLMINALKLLPAVLIMITSSIAGQTWNLVWADSFDGATINSANWMFELGANNGWGNAELECYTGRADNALVANGALHIIAKQEQYQGSDYTSARMISKGLQTWTYGKVEARIKLPQTQGLWPAFWMLGNNIDQVSWPVCGEIDIMEHVNFDPKIHGTMHWENNGHVFYGGSTNCSVTQYHTYSIEWGPDSINWKLDNILYHTANIKNNINNTDAFHKPFFLLLNMAVGGNWPGAPNSASTFPDTMLVDYVKVWQKGFPASLAESASPIASFGFLPQRVVGQLPFNYASTDHATLQVFDVCGKLVLQHTLAPAQAFGTLDCGMLSDNIYVYMVRQYGKLVGYGKVLVRR